MVKSPIKVFVRTRPTVEFCSDVLTLNQEKQAIDIHLKKSEADVVNNQLTDWSWKFDGILHNVSQDFVFQQCAKEIIDSVLEGYNGTLMAYGQTGAGKTFTMTGTVDNYQYRGIIPRTIAYVFRELANRPDYASTVRVSYLEIYNETMVDLLASAIPTPGVPAAAASTGVIASTSDTAGTTGKEDVVGGELLIQEDASGLRVGATHVRGLYRPVAASEEEALNLLFEGETNRAIAEHKLNKASSRSHCIFTIHLDMRSRVESSGTTLCGKLHLVDLAGSERVSKTQSEDINKSLSFLEQVILALGDPHRDHIPYRQCKLTNVLKDSLGGNCKTTMIANILPERRHLEETISTLKFATRVMNVSNEASINVQEDPRVLCRRYEREIKELKEELAMHDTMAGRARATYEPYTSEQRHELLLQVRRYIAGEVEELEFVNIRHTRELMLAFKTLFRQMRTELEHDLRQEGLGAPAGGAPAAASTEGTAPKGSGTPAPGGPPTSVQARPDGMVGELDGGRGFGLGVAPSDARPPTVNLPASATAAGTKASATAAELAAAPAPEGLATARDLRTADAAGAPNPDVPSRTEAFETWKKDVGAEAQKQLAYIRSQLAEKKNHAKQLVEQANTCKANIEELRRRLDDKRARLQAQQAAAAAMQAADAEADVTDQEVFEMLQSLNDAKARYKQATQDLKAARAEIEYDQRSLEQAKRKMLLDFEDWYAELSGLPKGADAEATSAAMRSRGFTPGATAGRMGTAGSAAEEDALDPGEQFERLEMARATAEDPDAGAFYAARKAARARKAAAGVRR